MFQPKNIYSVLSPIYYVTKVIGLTPFKIEKESFKKSALNLCWCLFVMLFLNIYTIASLNKRSVIEKEVISRITDLSDLVLSQSTMFFGILFGCISLNKVLTVFGDIDKFDAAVQNDFHIDLIEEYRKSKIYVIVGLTTALVCIGVSLGITSVSSNSALYFIGLYMAYVCPAMINTLIDFQFCALILCLKQRFRWLNKTILASTGLQHFTTRSNIFVKNKTQIPSIRVMQVKLMEDQIFHILEKIRINHHDLCTICKNLNSAYSFQVLLIVMHSFISMIVLLYYAGHRIMTNTFSLNYFLYCVTEILLSASQLVVLVAVCSVTSTEAHKTGILIHKAISMNIENKYNDDLQLEVSVFSLQLLHHNVEFTACKMFVINESLLFSIIGAVTTYLVIVIQFELGTIKRA